jgi:hypothetical protein
MYYLLSNSHKYIDKDLDKKSKETYMLIVQKILTSKYMLSSKFIEETYTKLSSHNLDEFIFGEIFEYNRDCAGFNLLRTISKTNE